jgi:hypothetical protein
LLSRDLSLRYILLPLGIITPLGFLFKFYAGPGRWWFADYGAGVLYELFWILVFFFIFPGRKSASRIPLWVFIITSGLECLQLFHPPVLERIRSCFLGRALIGATFVWWDFPHYAAGCLIGWLYLKRLDRKMALDACYPPIYTGTNP